MVYLNLKDMTLCWRWIDRAARSRAQTLAFAVFVLAFCSSLTSSSIAHGQVADPYFVLVDTGAASKAWSSYALSVIADYECSDLLASNTVKNFAAPPYYQVKNADGFRGETGTAVYQNVLGRICQLRFWSVSGKDAFDAFVESLVHQRGETAQVSGTEFQKRITVQSSPAVSGEPQISWNDCFVTYSNGIVAIDDSDAVYSFQFDKLVAILKNGQSKDWQLHLIPDAVPDSARKAMLTEIQKQMGVGLQRRNGEGAKEYAIRRFSIEAAAILLERSLFDLQQIKAWTDWPKDGKRFTAGLEISAKPDSELARSIDHLSRNAPTIESTPHQKAVGTISVNLSIPENVRPLLSSLILHLREEDRALSDVVAATLGDGQLEVVADLAETPDGSPVLSGGFRLHGEEASEDAVAAAIGGILQSSGSITRTFEPEVEGKSFGRLHLGIRMSEGVLRFSSSRSSVVIDDDQVRFREFGASRGNLLSASFDLRPWVESPADSEASILIRDLESAYQRWFAFRKTGDYLRMIRQTARIGDDFRSLSDQVPREGDWSLELNARSDETSLHLNCEIGRDLHRFALARQLVTEGEVRKLGRLRSGSR